MMAPFKLVVLPHLPILDQLVLEEALFRADQGNYCLLNTGSSQAVVLGLSSQLDLVVDEEKSKDVPLIRRFSGGGTVLVDSNTCFVTFIGGACDWSLSPYPQSILDWTASFYRKVFGSLPFALVENDYTLGDRKVGGNAQAFARNRFIHHTSFLWDYDPEKMACLKLPPKMPDYRNKRGHDEFLTKLSYFYPSRDEFLLRVEKVWREEKGGETILYESLREVQSRPHRRTLIKISNGGN